MENPQRFIRIGAVLERVPFSRSGLYSAIANGRFPPPIKIGPRASAWCEAEIEAWLAERLAQRDEAA